MESKPHPQGAGDLPYEGGLDRLSTQKLDHDNKTKSGPGDDGRKTTYGITH